MTERRTGPGTSLDLLSERLTHPFCDIFHVSTLAAVKRIGAVMSLFDALVKYFSREDTAGAPAEAPEGLCANCWGYEQYGGEIIKVARSRDIDLRNGRARNAFIQEFVVNHVEPIRLNDDGAGPYCKVCRERAAASS